MTQKELLYFEDAISHEESIVKICQNEMKEKLMSLLKEKVNG